jgi:flavorubredoxin
MTVINPSAAAGTALVVYHPGLSDFLRDVANAFAEGLVANGWRVELTSASAQAPRDLGRYDLLVLASPTYWWTPARPALRYVDRLDSLDGKATAILITASGQPARSRSVMEAHVRQKGGAIVASLALTAWKPNQQNDARPNKTVALGMAREAAKAVPAPHPTT